MEYYLFIFLLFFIPFIVSPNPLFMYEPIKVILAEVIIDFIFIIIIFKRKKLNKKIFPTKLFIIFCIFILSLINLIIFNSNTSLFGNMFRLQGTFLLWHLMVFSLIVPFIKIKKEFYKLPILSFIFLVISIIIFGHDLNGRIIGTFGEPNALASYVVFLWPVVFLKINNKYIKGLIFLISFLVVFLTGSRSGIIAFLIQIVFIILSLKFKLRIWITNLIIFLIFLVSLFLPYVDKQTVYQSRVNIWQTAFKAGLMNPIAGGGFGNTEKLINISSKQLGNNIQYLYVDSSHNLILDWWVQGGLLGVVGLLSLIFISMKRFIINKNYLEMTMFYGLLMTLLFNPASVIGLIGFWWLIGQS